MISKDKDGLYYKITIEISRELMQDLKAIQGFDSHEEYIDLLTKEFQKEIEKIWNEMESGKKE